MKMGITLGVRHVVRHVLIKVRMVTEANFDPNYLFSVPERTPAQWASQNHFVP